jgi:hypothetical protein
VTSGVSDYGLELVARVLKIDAGVRPTRQMQIRHTVVFDLSPARVEWHQMVPSQRRTSDSLPGYPPTSSTLEDRAFADSIGICSA